MKWTNHPRIFLELSIVKLCRPEQPTTVAAKPDPSLVERIAKLENQLSQFKNQPARPAQNSKPEPKEKRRVSKKSGVKVDTGRIKQLLNDASKQQLQQLKAQWGDVMDNVKNLKISAHACLIESQPVACSNDMFLLSFKHDIHCKMINDNEQHREVVEQAVRSVSGNDMKLLTAPTNEWEKLKAAYIQKQRGETADDEPEREDPLIAEAKKMFGAKWVEIKK
jgi:DNA polymerase-3 subunit gamma/tau